MAIAEQTETAVSTAPTRWEKIKAATEILFNSKVAMVGLLLVGFWVIVATFADDCIIRPQHWGTCLAGETRYDDASP